jgi:5-methylcytosine-specific restriction endonuclease McrA
MAWIELHQNLSNHPKLIRLATRLGLPRVTAMGHLVSLWLWALDYAEDGSLKGFGAVEIAAGAGWPGDPADFLKSLQECRWMDKMALHDWMDYAGRLVEKRVENKVRQKRFRDRTRMPIYNRDGGLCGYCGEPVPISKFYVDHIVPIAKGGDNNPKNLVTSCNSCNISKGGRTPEEAGMMLLRDAQRNALRTGATVPNRTQPTEPSPPSPSGALQVEFEKARKAYPGTRRGLAPEWEAFQKKHGKQAAEIVPLLLPAISRYRAYVEKKARGENRPPMWQHFKTWLYQSGWTAEYPGQAVAQDEAGKARAQAHYREHGFYPPNTPNAWMGT